MTVRKLTKNIYGFGHLGIIAITVAVIIVVAIGWLVASNNKNLKKETNNDAVNISAAGTNPSSGWTQQCLASQGLCLKHPANWSVDLINSSEFSLTSPDSTSLIQVEQVSNYSSNTEKFYVSSQAYVYSGTSYKVIGGYTEGQNSNSAFYAVVLPGFGDPNAMKVGSAYNILVTQFIDYLHNGKAFLASAKLMPISLSLASNTTPQEANQWFRSATTQVGVEILKTLTTN